MVFAAFQTNSFYKCGDDGGATESECLLFLHKILNENFRNCFHIMKKRNLIEPNIVFFLLLFLSFLSLFFYFPL